MMGPGLRREDEDTLLIRSWIFFTRSASLPLGSRFRGNDGYGIVGPVSERRGWTEPWPSPARAVSSSACGGAPLRRRTEPICLTQTRPGSSIAIVLNVRNRGMMGPGLRREDEAILLIRSWIFFTRSASLPLGSRFRGNDGYGIVGPVSERLGWTEPWPSPAQAVSSSACGGAPLRCRTEPICLTQTVQAQGIAIVLNVRNRGVMGPGLRRDGETTFLIRSWIFFTRSASLPLGSRFRGNDGLSTSILDFIFICSPSLLLGSRFRGNDGLSRAAVSGAARWALAAWRSWSELIRVSAAPRAVDRCT